jgi:hypothetical protein
LSILLVNPDQFSGQAAMGLILLDRGAQREFGGLLRWAWPWSIGDGGLLGRIPASGEYLISGVFLAGAAALMFILANAGSDGVVGSVWLVEGSGYGGAILSLLLMMGFFGAAKRLSVALDLVILWAAIIDRLPAPPSG